MTRQILDEFDYEGETYYLTAASAPIPFSLEQYGIETSSMLTACWRKFYCLYTIVDGWLQMCRLSLISNKTDDPPPIDGRKAKWGRNSLGHEYSLNLKIPYTGHLLIGRDLAPEWRDYALYPDPQGYRFAVELVFDSGRLRRAVDQSETLKEMRKYLDSRPEPSYEDKANWRGWHEWRRGQDLWAWLRGERPAES